MIEKQELHCHECNMYVQFELDTELNGNHILSCPNCGHEHCRVIKDGKITSDRWSSRNSNYSVNSTTCTYSTSSTFDSTGTANYYTYGAWMNTTTTG